MRATPQCLNMVLEKDDKTDKAQETYMKKNRLTKNVSETLKRETKEQFS
jgi:hypothetical protein